MGVFKWMIPIVVPLKNGHFGKPKRNGGAETEKWRSPAISGWRLSTAEVCHLCLSRFVDASADLKFVLATDIEIENW